MKLCEQYHLPHQGPSHQLAYNLHKDLEKISCEYGLKPTDPQQGTNYNKSVHTEDKQLLEIILTLWIPYSNFSGLITVGDTFGTCPKGKKTFNTKGRFPYTLYCGNNKRSGPPVPATACAVG